MSADLILDSLETIDAELIEHAGMVSPRKHRNWKVWAAAAACFCLILGSVILFRGQQAGSPKVQQWSASMGADAYFRNSGGNAQSTAAPSSFATLVMAPYAAVVSFGDDRGALEKEGVLPEMPEHGEHSFRAEYNGDGSLYKVECLWMRRNEGSLDGYSDLRLIAAPKELHEVSDLVLVEVDENGAPLSPDVTATVRDGVTIYAEGRENRPKTLTWETVEGWYQLSGSFKDSYEDLVALLDWFWAHPFPLDRFDAPPDGTFVFSDRSEHPEAFWEQIPDFADLGYAPETERVNLRLRDASLVPVWFDGIYTRGETRVRWTVSVGADADAWAACLGRPGGVTETQLTEALAEKDYVNLFFDLPCMATLRVENGTVADAWEIVQSLTGGG